MEFEPDNTLLNYQDIAGLHFTHGFTFEELSQVYKISKYQVKKFSEKSPEEFLLEKRVQDLEKKLERINIKLNLA